MNQLRALCVATALAMMSGQASATIITLGFNGTFTSRTENPFDPTTTTVVSNPVRGAISYDDATAPVSVDYGGRHAVYASAITGYSVTSNAALFIQYFGSSTVTGSGGLIDVEGGERIYGNLRFSIEPVQSGNISIFIPLNHPLDSSALTSGPLTLADVNSDYGAPIIAGVGCGQGSPCAPITEGSLSSFTLAPAVLQPLSPPTAVELAILSEASYTSNRLARGTGIVNTSYSVVQSTDPALGFSATEFQNGNQVVLAFRGTNTDAGLNEAELASFKDIIADGSFATGVPDVALTSYVAKASAFLQKVQNECGGCTITLTGHSLGGAIADIEGVATGLNTSSFNAPGAGRLLTALGVTQPIGSNIVDYRLGGMQYHWLASVSVHRQQ